ncbi:hypothetical protein KI387_029420, partial [Taxus chinensis]
GEQEVGTRDEMTTINPQEQSQEHHQTVSPSIFPLPLDDVQPVIAEDADVFGTSGIGRICFSYCSNDSRELRSNPATTSHQHGTAEIQENLALITSLLRVTYWGQCVSHPVTS